MSFFLLIFFSPQILSPEENKRTKYRLVDSLWQTPSRAIVAIRIESIKTTLLDEQKHTQKQVFQ